MKILSTKHGVLVDGEQREAKKPATKKEAK